MKAYRCILSSHDFFFYVAKEMKLGLPSDLISNTALLYAFNTHIPRVQRNASGSKPHYAEDMKKFTIYSTPAKLLMEDTVIKNGKLDRWNGVSRELKRITYNAIHTVTQITESVMTVPTMGYYLKYRPFTPFECFILGGKSGPIIRLGKKLPPVRVHFQPLEDMEIVKDEVFSPSHPVNYEDLPQSTELLECRLEIVPPVPLLRHCKLKGDFLKGRVKNITYKIALPNPKIYSNLEI